MLAARSAPKAQPAVEAGGLTNAEAARRLAAHGPNSLPSQPSTPVWRRVGLQLRDPLILVLLAAAGLTVATGDHTDASIIAIVIAVNTTVGVVQEVRADNAIAALRRLTAVSARAVRDGTAATVAVESLVPGDLILLGEGDIVPADSRVVEAARMLVDESTLTGESFPADKKPGDEIASGTIVTHGRGRGLVLRTGRDSATGQIAATLTSGPALTPLQHRLAALGRTLAVIAGVLAMVVMTVGLVRGQPVELMIVTAVSLIVAAVPESLPAVVTLSLAMGARRMAQRHAIVRRLPAVETLGSVTVIATDKTGTLTEGRMVAELIWTPEQEVVLTGSGTEHNQQVSNLLRAVVLCNDASLRPAGEPSEASRTVGDPTEVALLNAAIDLWPEAEEARRMWPRIAEDPFDSDSKRMVTVHRGPGGKVLLACKGAPEAVLNQQTLRDDARVLEAALARADALAESGYRVLAVASAVRDDVPDTPESAQAGLTVNGLVALADPPRTSATATIAACRAAGIIPVLITGDHQATARHVAERVGVSPRGGRYALGGEIGNDAPSPTDVSVFARTSPSDKLRLVTEWQQRGDVVAMTGDGVNDAPALRRADIGVAMGVRGTDIARQAADMVLADDELATIVAAVEEGRRAYANVRRFLLYGLAGGTAELVVMLLGPAVGLPLPLLPSQILWLNLLTHGLPGVAMGAEPTTPDAMQRPPRPVGEGVLAGGLWQRVLVIAVTLSALALGAGAWAHATDHPAPTTVFLVLGMAQFGVALAVRAQPGTSKNPFLLLAVACSFLLLLAGVYAGPLRSLLSTHALAPLPTVALSAAAVIGYGVTRAARRFHHIEI